MRKTARKAVVISLAILVAANSAFAIIELDVDGNGNVDVHDIDRWNFLLWNEPCLVAACVPEMDVNLDGILCFGDRDVLVLATFRLYGDANGDGVVNSQDMNRVGMNWQQPGTWSQGDFNGDGIVDSKDLNIVGLNWGKTHNQVLDGTEIDSGRCECPHCIFGDGNDQ